MIRKMILLSMAGRPYTLPVEKVGHIIPAPRKFPLVCLRPEIDGVFLHAEEPTPMLNPGQFPELELAEKVDGEYVIVFQSEYGNIGLPVDAAVTIVDAEDGVYENVEPVETADESSMTFLYKEQSYQLLDIDALLARLQY